MATPWLRQSSSAVIETSRVSLVYKGEHVEGTVIKRLGLRVRVLRHGHRVPAPPALRDGLKRYPRVCQARVLVPHDWRLGALGSWRPRAPAPPPQAAPGPRGNAGMQTKIPRHTYCREKKFLGPLRRGRVSDAR